MKAFPATDYPRSWTETKKTTGSPRGLNGIVVTSGTITGARRAVTCGSIIKGNKKDPLPWSYNVEELQYLNGSNVQTNTYVSGIDKGTFVVTSRQGQIHNGLGHGMNAPATPSNLANQALSRLNEKVRGSLDLSVSLAQAGQTARMFKVTNEIAKFIREFKDWRKLAANVSNARLQFVYGWRPLASDLYSAADESLRVVINEIESVKARASQVVPSGISYVSISPYGSVPVTMTRSGLYVVEYGLRFRTAGHDLDRWTSLNPVSIAYELLPYSFVFDWFWDVGSYLRNLETSLLYKNSFVSGYLSNGAFYDVSGDANAFRSQWNTSYYTYSIVGTCRAKYRSFTRSILSSYPAPRLPRFEADLGSSRLLNLAALMGQKLGVSQFRR